MKKCNVALSWLFLKVSEFYINYIKGKDNMFRFRLYLNTGHKWPYWPHIILQVSLFHFSRGLLLSLSLLSLTVLAVSSCASLQIYLWVNYHIAPWANKNRSSPLRQTVRGAVQCWSNATLTVYQGKPWKNVCILSSVHTAVGTFSGHLQWGEGKTRVFDVQQHQVRCGPGPDARAYSVKGGAEDGRWRSSITSSWTWLGSMHASYPRSPEESPAAAGRGAEGRIHGGELPKELQMELQKRAANRTKRRTLEMPQARVWWLCLCPNSGAASFKDPSFAASKGRVLQRDLQAASACCEIV